jgi:EAL domain-containing protein (putative c-di-GMP-specific phosphodiesterase class I)
VRYERTQAMADGERFRLFAQYLPHFGTDGKVAGVFSILTDISGARDLGPPPVNEEPDADDGAAARLVRSLERGEFCLYSQPVAPLRPTDEPGVCMEILLRLREEEENHLPAGMFLPAAEEAGLMPQIDRWVVGKVLAAASDPSQTYFVNVSPSTIAEPGFAEFVEAELIARGRSGRSLCFEFWERDVVENPCAYRDFTAALAPRGCRFAVSGSSCNVLTMPLLRQLHVGFLKLDGCIVLNALRDAADLQRIATINAAARAAGIKTIGECVEDEATRNALRRAGTDFAQGFGIAVPRLMKTPARGLETAALVKAA